MTIIRTSPILLLLLFQLFACGGGQAGGDGGRDAGRDGVVAIEGDPCLALAPVFAAADCRDEMACPSVTCDCGATRQSFGACANGRCVTGIDCAVACRLPAPEIGNCVRRIY